MKERGEGRKRRQEGGSWEVGEIRKKEEERKKEGRNNKERKRQTGGLARQLEKHTEVGIWSRTESATCSVRNRNSGIRSELKESKFQFLQLQNENTNFQAL